MRVLGQNTRQIMLRKVFDLGSVFSMEEVAAHFVDLQEATGNQLTFALCAPVGPLGQQGFDVGLADLDAHADAELIKVLRGELGFVGSDEEAYHDLPDIV